MATTIIRIRDEGKFPKISWRVPLEAADANGFVAFKSRASVMKEIMEALTGANALLIGLHGMGGVGKTMLLKEIAKQAKDGFDETVMATVTQSPQVIKIQDEIADFLGLKLEESSESGRASRLRQRLRNGGKILVILDDIWEELDLERVGIPHAVDHKGLKILMSSRSREVLAGMGVKKNFELKVLDGEESKNFFHEMTSDFVESLELKAEVADECGGLPLSLITTAKALKGKMLPEWKDALRRFRNHSQPSSIVQQSIYSSLKLSYDYLKEEARSLFLLCSLFPEDYQINVKYLLIYATGMGLLHDVNSLVEGRDRIHSLVHDLKASSLLLDGINCDFVQMHDVCRDMAITIASETYKVRYGLRNDDIRRLLESRSYAAVSTMSLSLIDDQELPKEVKCQKLKFLLLIGSKSKSSLVIPESFFANMRELEVLDLTSFSIPRLPSSVGSLDSLQALCLDDCILPEITVIGELKKLEILSLESSDIEELPSVIGELRNLRMLNLSDCSNLKVIPPNLISRLTELVDLYMDNSFNQWDIGSNASIAELNPLLKLATLYIHIPNAGILPEAAVFMRLIRYRIFIGDNWVWSNGYGKAKILPEDSRKSIGDDWDWTGNYEVSRTLKLKQPSRSFQREAGVASLMENTEDLHIDELKGMESILYKLDKDVFPYLKHLLVQNNVWIKSIVSSSTGHVGPVAFPSLESMVLKNLRNLKLICNGTLPRSSFGRLKKLKLEFCNMLGYIFPSRMGRDLLKLQQLEVSDCRLLNAIFAKRIEKGLVIEECDQFNIPELQSLVLQNLPALVGFYFNESLESHLESSSESRALFSNEVSCPKLEMITLSYLIIEKIWQDRLPRNFSSVQNLTSLTVEYCSRLKYLFSTAAAKSFKLLKRLEIRSNQMMEHLVVAEQRGNDNPVEQSTFDEEVLLPNLETIIISDMDSLETLLGSTAAPGSFAKLKKVDVSYCRRLPVIFPHRMLDKVKSLERLKVMNCDSLQEVFQCHSEEPTPEDNSVVAPIQSNLRKLSLLHLRQLKHVWSKDTGLTPIYPNLEIVLASYCESLKTIFPTSIARGLARLKELKINSCGVKEIVVEEEGIDATIEFPELTTLSLQNLFEFKSGSHTFKCPRLNALKNNFGYKVPIIYASEDRIIFHVPEDRPTIGTTQLFFSDEKVELLDRQPKKANFEGSSSFQHECESSHRVKVTAAKSKAQAKKTPEKPSSARSKTEPTEAPSPINSSCGDTTTRSSSTATSNNVDAQLDELKAQLATVLQAQNQMSKQLATIASAIGTLHLSNGTSRLSANSDE